MAVPVLNGTLPVKPSVNRSRLVEIAGVCAGLALVTLVLIRTAWLSDDAYITLRTIDNFWSGYGLRWNVAERVQAFTHPLWLIILGALYGVTHEAYWTTIALSLAVSVAVLLVLTLQAAVTPLQALAVLAVSVSSKAFIEYSTSGLENALTHLLLAIVVVDASTQTTGWQAIGEATCVTRTGAEHRAKRGDEGGPRLTSPLRLATLASLCVLNRLDMMLLVGPVAGAAIASHGSRKSADALLGSWPLVAWALFALIYYGSPLPNTYFAKIATGVPAAELMAQGRSYLLDSVTTDPVTLTVIGLTIVLSVTRRHRNLGVFSGLVLYLLYILRVGGDFMSGRFLTAPFVMSLAYLAGRSWTPLPWFLPAAAAVVLGLSSSAPPLMSPSTFGVGEPFRAQYGEVADERRFYYPSTGLLRRLSGNSLDHHPWSEYGRELQGVPQVIVQPAVGFMGYYGGPAVHIVDPNALADALLAKLPALRPWRIGHFERDIPVGYVETLQRCLAVLFPHGAIRPPTENCADAGVSTASSIRDPAIAKRYADLSLITQSAIWSRARLARLVGW